MTLSLVGHPRKTSDNFATQMPHRCAHFHALGVQPNPVDAARSIPQLPPTDSSHSDPLPCPSCGTDRHGGMRRLATRGRG